MIGLLLFDLFQQVERILYQITELTTTLKQEEEYLQKLLGLVPVISTLLVSLTLHTLLSLSKKLDLSFFSTFCQLQI